MDILTNFVQYALANDFEAKLIDNAVILYNVKNPGNDFKIVEMDGYYSVFTMRISSQDYEYMAKCMVYVLLASYNKAHAASNHLHINFKVQL